MVACDEMFEESECFSVNEDYQPKQICDYVGGKCTQVLTSQEQAAGYCEDKVGDACDGLCEFDEQS